MKSKQLYNAAGIASVFEGFIYIAMFIYFGLFAAYPSQDNQALFLEYLTSHQTVLGLVYFIGYICFGVCLAILVIGLHHKLQPKEGHPALTQIATLFGCMWIVLVIASGMIANIGLGQVVSLAATDQDAAFQLWQVIGVLVESLGGGNELVGGIWVFLVSWIGIQLNVLSKSLHYLGLFVGSAGIATVYPADVITEIFGITQIVWFIWLGIVLMRK